jgi:hypothetical protein
MIKYILLGLILLVSFSLSAEKLLKSVSEQGEKFIGVMNDTSYPLVCQIWNDTYFVDFTVAPSTSSRWYIEPTEAYSWECHE